MISTQGEPTGIVQRAVRYPMNYTRLASVCLMLVCMVCQRNPVTGLGVVRVSFRAYCWNSRRISRRVCDFVLCPIVTEEPNVCGYHVLSRAHSGLAKQYKQIPKPSNKQGGF